MKRVIDGKVYDTDKATLIGEYDNGLGGDDFNNLQEGLYLTKKGAYFIAGSGGALSKYAGGNGRESWGGEGIEVVSKHEALTWCEKHSIIEGIEEHFADMIEDG